MDMEDMDVETEERWPPGCGCIMALVIGCALWGAIGYAAYCAWRMFR